MDNSYLSHSDLGMSEKEYHALLTVKQDTKSHKISVDMMYAYSCISGWVSFYMESATLVPITKMKVRVISNDACVYLQYHKFETSKIGKLYFPWRSFKEHTPFSTPYNWSYKKVGAQYIVQAIENFLKFGDPKWETVMANHPDMKEE